MTSAQVANEVSAYGYVQRLREYHSRGALDSDAYMTELVGSVAEPLIVAAKDLYPQTTDWNWEWHLADTGEINAYCMPGGRIIVLSGLLSDQVLGDDRDMLATILAHEVSHAILQHTRESMGRGWLAQGLAWTMAKSLKIGALREQEMVKDLKLAFLDPKSRILEAEADVLGLELMSRAGFDSAKAVATWEHMAEGTHSNVQDVMTQRAMAFLSDHPSDRDRLARMKALQPKAAPLAAKGKHWDWAVQGISDQQADILDKVAGAFGLGASRFSITERQEIAKRVAQVEGIHPRQAAEELDKALWETGLSQGGAIQMGLTAMVRGVGGWERLERICAAWAKSNPSHALYQDPAQATRLNLSDTDRSLALSGMKRVEAYLNSDRFIVRLWRDVASEIGKTRPKAAEAIRDWLQSGMGNPASNGGRAGQ
ncbi:Zn-dependent protease with chaperone function [Paramagnetospirillum magnetotacticum MS-1]|uniref:Zn-dependent protease with chaperone function n=1 Tax=Paramagnetospirillum magnetotacticum MS-1 TaxID=272627 RepID=A0A0C2YL56_PARME|nr:M48 family metallopeptidase [Paramagnetospirillum magnetotacticum]KIM00515.1 Zn-dependent protease with chaperone function [Paramagnetospirillum magnetotacticum MS-1]